ncbi:2-keto-4-pentenoate hydratase [Paracraurococcus lichenis]|uniref:Fumarylacetoacetate hydrolase family protein n=1 Tax=Paracraurococcus lichenis TaxID=3064888 RepID=A0ABT9DZD4_9PROT|nr:fumarylacetoacetate hydrolase family protein [Paracraurococcus sp. LOR1-02]MDO9709269.1 fumarylacetoacetate hydrolase family protein [Paracraurococcus sp. LOR1-02]
MSAAADAILAAREAKRILEPLGAAAPATPEAGYAVQHEVAERLGAVPPFGFKIGATTRQMQDYLGLAGPAAGFVPRTSLNPDGAALRFADFLNPGVECEVGIRLGRDLPPGPTTREQAAEAVAEVFPAIEIVERRYGDLALLGTPTLIADQVFHAAGVLGAPVADWRRLDLGAARGTFHVGGKVVGSGFGRDLLGHPLEALAWLAGSGAARAFGGLRAGQVVWLGSVTPPIWLEGPCEVVAEFDLLGKATLRFT